MKEEKTFHCEKKLETMCSTNYWLLAAIAIATMSTELWLREREGLVIGQQIDGLLDIGLSIRLV